MKRILTLIGAAFILAAVPQSIPAQDRQGDRQQDYQQRTQRGEHGRGRREQMTPEKMATRTADRLKETLGLDEKQYKKIYNYHLGVYTEQMENGTLSGNRMDGEMRSPGNGGNPEMHRRRDGGNRGERPQLTEEQRAQMQAKMKERMEERLAAEQERREVTARKYKKILTPEQYAKWEEMEANEVLERKLRMEEQRERRQNSPENNGGNHPGRSERRDSMK